LSSGWLVLAQLPVGETNEPTAAAELQNWCNQLGIENQYFYFRDVTLREDASRLYTSESPCNMATFRNAALGLLRSLDLENKARTLREHALNLPKLARRLGQNRLKHANKFFRVTPCETQRCRGPEQAFRKNLEFPNRSLLTIAEFE